MIFVTWDVFVTEYKQMKAVEVWESILIDLSLCQVFGFAKRRMERRQMQLVA